MAGVVQQVGLGRGEQHAVDAAAEEVGEERVRALPEAGEDVGQRVLQVLYGGGPGIERGERIDQHDLPVEPGEMAIEEGLHDGGDIGLVAPLHQRAERASWKAPYPDAMSSGAKASRGEPL